MEVRAKRAAEREARERDDPATTPDASGPAARHDERPAEQVEDDEVVDCLRSHRDRKGVSAVSGG